MNEPVIKAVRKARTAHKRTPAGHLETLRSEMTRWLRKETIARSKLEEVRAKILKLSRDICDKAGGWPFCEDCQSWHAPENPTCFKLQGKRARS